MSVKKFEVYQNFYSRKEVYEVASILDKKGVEYLIENVINTEGLEDSYNKDYFALKISRNDFSRVESVLKQVVREYSPKTTMPKRKNTLAQKSVKISNEVIHFVRDIVYIFGGTLYIMIVIISIFISDIALWLVLIAILWLFIERL